MSNLPSAFHSIPKSGRSFGVVGDVYTIRATGAQTGGALCLIEARVGPGGGPPPHVHANDDESFFVLDGTITFSTADGAVQAGPGTFLHMPRGVAHRFQNETDREARMLFWCTPSGFDRFIETVGVPLPNADAPPTPPTAEDIDRLVRACPEFGLTLLERLG